jgi:hypothetical protein
VSGKIQANGGNGYNQYNHYSGGGAGGRIAIDVPTANNTYSGTTTANGGSGNQYGGAGSVYWVTTDRLIVSNGGYSGAMTLISTGNHHFDHRYRAESTRDPGHISLTVVRCIGWRRWQQATGSGRHTECINFVYLG